MKVIANELGRVLQLIVMEEIKPISGVYLPNLYEGVAERYKFVGRPQNLGDAISQGAKFQHGRLFTPNKTVILNEIGIFNDGIIIDALNTDDAEFVLADLISWATDVFGLRKRMTIISKRFTSILTVEFDTSIEEMLRGVSIIASGFSTAYEQAYSEKIETNLLRLGINADPLGVPPLRNTQFYIERRLQRPYAENRYQSGAPLRTEEHVALLRNMEHALSQSVLRK